MLIVKAKGRIIGISMFFSDVHPLDKVGKGQGKEKNIKKEPYGILGE